MFIQSVVHVTFSGVLSKKHQFEKVFAGGVCLVKKGIAQTHPWEVYQRKQHQFEKVFAGGVCFIILETLFSRRTNCFNTYTKCASVEYPPGVRLLLARALSRKMKFAACSV